MNEKNKKKIILFIDELNLGYKLIDVFNKLKKKGFNKFLCKKLYICSNKTNKN